MDSETAPNYTIRRKPVRASTDITSPSSAIPAPVTSNSRPRANTQPSHAQPGLTIPRKPLSSAATNVKATGGIQRSLSTPISTGLRARSHQQPDILTPLLGTHLPRKYSTKRLTKPPKLHARKHSHRKKLQKRVKRKPSDRLIPLSVFILQYERYPYNTEPGMILGAYSSIETVTTAAIKHGAYAFSKEGMQDGTEYLSASGRIKILKQTIQRTGPRASIPRGQHLDSHNRKTNPAPGPFHARELPEAPVAIDGKEGVLVAVHQSPSAIFCIGAFTERKRAWGACMKHRFTSPFSRFAVEGEGWVDEYQMPHLKAREPGIGWHEWFVVPFRVDEVVGQASGVNSS